MSKYTSGKTTQKRDKCIQRKSSEISALKAEIDALKAQNAELISSFSEVLRISDRQHDAWEAAKKAIAKARGESA